MPDKDCRALFFEKTILWHSMTQMPIQSPSLLTVTAHRSWLTIRHAEFSSASHREPLLVLLCGLILKFAVKREQRQAYLNFAEREQIEHNQIQDDHQLCSVVFCYIVEYCCPV